MKKSFFILFIFIMSSLLIFCNLYAGSIIDKSQDGYMLLIPKNATLEVKCPVLVCLPGYGVPAMKDINVWAYPADKMGFLVINFDVKYDTIKSNWDVQVLYERIERTIDHLSKIYPIDTEKVFIAGTSAGGMMSIALALKYPQRFLAIGVVCGAELSYGAEENLRNARGSWFYMVHGQRDKRVPIGKFYSTKKRLEKNGAIVEFSIIPEGEHTLPSGVYKDVVEWLAKVMK